MPGNRQQKLAAKAARRKQAVAAKLHAERLASSPAGRVAAAATGSIERCLRLGDMVEAGIGHVVLARRSPSGALGCGFFLVDLLCLGVKDAFFREMAPSELDDWVERLRDTDQVLVPIAPASAKKLVLDAVAFATASGLDPHKDYRTVFKLFDGVDAGAATESFPLGRNGKPLFIPGPHDGTARMREIERKLVRTRGDDWDADIAVPTSERIALRGLADLLDRDLDDADGPVIEHDPDEGAGDPLSDATADEPPAAEDDEPVKPSA